MDRFYDKLRQPADTHQRHSSLEGKGHSDQESIDGQNSEFRQLALQTIVCPNRQETKLGRARHHPGQFEVDEGILAVNCDGKRG